MSRHQRSLHSDEEEEKIQEGYQEHLKSNKLFEQIEKDAEFINELRKEYEEEFHYEIPPLTKKQIHKEVYRFVSAKKKPTQFRVCNVRQGTGKTTACIKYCDATAEEHKKCIISTAQHAHIDEEFIKKFKETIPCWIRGFPKMCGKYSTIKIIEDLYRIGYRASILCKIFCTRIERESCDYHMQFIDAEDSEEIIIPNELIAFVNERYGSNIREIFVDEGIDKHDLHYYAYDDSKIEDICNPERYRTFYKKIFKRKRKRYKREELKNTFYEGMSGLKQILYAINRVVKKKSILKPNMNVEEEVKKHFSMRFNKDNEVGYLVSHMKKLSLDKKTVKEYELLYNSNRQTGFVRVVKEISIEIIRELMGKECRNKRFLFDLLKDITWITNLNGMLDYVFGGGEVVVNEKITKNSDGWVSKPGKIIGRNKPERVWFNFYIPQLWNFLKVCEEIPITLLSASFVEEKYKIQIDYYNKIYDKKIKLMTFTLDNLPKYNARIFEVKNTYNKSWAKGNLMYKHEPNELFQEIIDDIIVPIMRKTDAGLISYLSLFNDTKINKESSSYLLNHFSDSELKERVKGHFSKGVTGSNFLESKNNLIIAGTPNPPPETIITDYIKLFHEFPPVEYIEQLKNKKGEIMKPLERSVIPRDLQEIKDRTLTGYKHKKLDLVFETQVRQTIIDEVGRLRDLDDEKKQIFMFCHVPEKIKNDLRVTNLNLEILRYRVLGKNFGLWLMKELNKRKAISFLDILEEYKGHNEHINFKKVLKLFKKEMKLPIIVDKNKVRLKVRTGLGIKYNLIELDKKIINLLPSTRKEIVKKLSEVFPDKLVDDRLRKKLKGGELKRVKTKKFPQEYEIAVAP